MTANLSVTICGVTFPSCLLNASGPCCTTEEELAALGRSASGAIVTKSMTREPREGNPEPRYYEFPLGSLNSMGMPNPGCGAYGEIFPRLRAFGKPIIASIGGLAEAEYREVAGYIGSRGADMVEVNLSCPNLVGKAQWGYDFEASERILREVRPLVDTPLGVKLPPYFDPVHQEAMAAVLRRTGVDFVVAINSVGNALIIDPEREAAVIRPKGGFGGLGGPIIRPIALANVRAFYELLEGRRPIVGVGGVANGSDAFEHLLAGASLVGIGTALAKEGPSVFARLEGELREVLASKGYGSPAEAVGRLIR